MKKVKGIMTKAVISCSPETTIREVAGLMKTHNCGFIPITDENKKLTGVVTDRDICLIMSERASGLQDLEIEHIMQIDLHTCTPNDNLGKALDIIRTGKISRLPVVNDEFKLEGIISISDILFHQLMNRWDEDLYGINAETILGTIGAISESRLVRETLENKLF